MQNDEKRIAVFIDFENVAMGVRESKYGNFDIDLVLKRLVEKGKIMVKRAYSDWHRYAEFKRAFHQAAIELIDVPQTRYSGKNSADIRMVVDALDLSYQKEHIDTFVLVSGDSDFSPLVSKLRENGRYVIGMGVKQSSSDLLINNCDEFIFYEDLVRPAAAVPVVDPHLHHLSPKKAEAIRLVLETFQALQREGKEVIYGSMIKQTLIRKLPSFNETYYGYPMFSRLLEDAAENKLLKLAKDQKSGGYVVTVPNERASPAAAFGAEGEQPASQSGEDAATGTNGSASAGVSVPFEPRDRFRRSRWDRGRHRSERRPDSAKSARSVPAASAAAAEQPSPGSEGAPGSEGLGDTLQSSSEGMVEPPPRSVSPSQPPVIDPLAPSSAEPAPVPPAEVAVSEDHRIGKSDPEKSHRHPRGRSQRFRTKTVAGGKSSGSANPVSEKLGIEAPSAGGGSKRVQGPPGLAENSVEAQASEPGTSKKEKVVRPRRSGRAQKSTTKKAKSH